jgi:hypothetical protein
MAKTMYASCPFCDGMMEIDAETGDVINKWSASEKHQNAGDRMQAALKKLEDDKKRRATLFDQTKGEIEGQKKKLESAFEKEVKRLKKEGLGDKPPVRPFDLD